MLCDQIKKLRHLRGINQVELANELGVTKQSVSNWENDNIMPSVEMLIKIADYFNVSIDYLLERTFKQYIETTNLTELQMVHIQSIVNDFNVLNKSKN